MQLLAASRNDLLEALSRVVGIVEKRHTMQILANVLMEKQGHQVSFVATDLELQITARTEFGVGDDDYQTTVNAMLFKNIVSGFAESTEVSLSMTGKKASIMAGSGKYSLQTLDVSDFPKVRTPDVWEHTFQVKQSVLHKLISLTHFAMASQDIRFYLNGMLFAFEPGCLSLVATDGHRLAVARDAIDGVEAPTQVIVPRKAVKHLQALLDIDNDAVVTIKVSTSAKQIAFELGGVELISKLVEGKYPDYNRVLPTANNQTATINRDELLKAIMRVCQLLKDKTKSIKLSFDGGNMVIKATNADQEEGQENIAMQYDGAPFDIGFNAEYIVNVLSVAKSDDIVWKTRPDSSSSALILVPGEDQFQYVVMPMRI